MPIKIVLIEDSETVQIAAKMVMHSEREYEVLCLKSPRELNSLGQIQPDLFMIDWSVFNENDSNWINSRPIIFLIGAQAIPPKTQFPKSQFLRKPFDSQSLLKAIQTALASEQKSAQKPVLPLPPMENLRSKPPLAVVGAGEASVSISPAPEVRAANMPISREEFREIARKVIEEVAWEVVPELAESIIREEIRRLTKEGR